MKKNWRILFAMMALSLVLSACGSSTTENKESEKTDDATVTEVEESEDLTEVDKDEVAQDEVATEEPTEEPAEESILGKESEDVNSTDSEVVTETTTNDILNEATLVDSDEQSYSMYVLPSYKLTSEEPGRDSLYSETDDSIFMRIETMPKEDGAYDYLEENMLVVLDASSDGDTPVELSDADTLPSGESITKAKAFKVNAETGPVTGILFERGDLIIRLTIFDSAENKHYNDFLQMGETVTIN